MPLPLGHLDLLLPTAAAATADWWAQRIAFLVIAASTFLFTALARRGWRSPVRRIPGIAAIEEAVGRATEMGRPILFCGGIHGLQKIQTVASFPILDHVAALAARYGERLLVPICQPEILPVSLQVARDAYRREGREVDFRPDDLRYLPGGQFYFALSAMGWMQRERPAACVYFGYYEAEALLFGETGRVCGALQIAATTEFFQIPFFIATCDHVVICEEFFAASAQVSGDPVLIGSLASQDFAKLLLIVVLLIGLLVTAIS
ncbi:MAG: DUF6754 domain-containing protein [Planctomycetota bacterium]